MNTDKQGQQSCECVCVCVVGEPLACLAVITEHVWNVCRGTCVCVQFSSSFIHRNKHVSICDVIGVVLYSLQYVFRFLCFVLIQNDLQTG